MQWGLKYTTAKLNYPVYISQGKPYKCKSNLELKQMERTNWTTGWGRIRENKREGKISKIKALSTSLAKGDVFSSLAAQRKELADNTFIEHLSQLHSNSQRCNRSGWKELRGHEFPVCKQNKERRLAMQRRQAKKHTAEHYGQGE